jgi:hypothetical protein
MSIELSYKNLTNKDDAYTAVKSKVNEEMMKKFKVKASINADDINQRIKAKGKGFELILDFLDTKVVADLDLSFLLKPLRSKINSELEKELSRVL